MNAKKRPEALGSRRTLGGLGEAEERLASVALFLAAFVGRSVQHLPARFTDWPIGWLCRAATIER